MSGVVKVGVVNVAQSIAGVYNTIGNNGRLAENLVRAPPPHLVLHTLGIIDIVVIFIALFSPILVILVAMMMIFSSRVSAYG